MSKIATDVQSLIDALGGLTPAAAALGASPQAVWNWIDRGQIPARLFLRHQAAIQAKQISAPPRLWGQDAEVSA